MSLVRVIAPGRARKNQLHPPARPVRNEPIRVLGADDAADGRSLLHKSSEARVPVCWPARAASISRRRFESDTCDAALACGDFHRPRREELGVEVYQFSNHALPKRKCLVVISQHGCSKFLSPGVTIMCFESVVGHDVTLHDAAQSHHNSEPDFAKFRHCRCSVAAAKIGTSMIYVDTPGCSDHGDGRVERCAHDETGRHSDRHAVNWKIRVCRRKNNNTQRWAAALMTSRVR